MIQQIILLSDHTWYAVTGTEQAKRFVNNHKWKDNCPKFGLYITAKEYQYLVPEGEEENED